MTDHSLPPASPPINLAAALRSLGQRARAGVQGEGRRWLLEVCVIMAVIVALSIALQPRVMLLQASPHPFWLPVVAAALVHGTLPGLATAILAGICAWLFGGSIATTEEDFYDLMFRAFKEPVLWFFAAILLGTFRDRIEEERQKLGEERDEARGDLAEVVQHAMDLRHRIDELERQVVLVDLHHPAKAQADALERSEDSRPAAAKLVAHAQPSTSAAEPAPPCPEAQTGHSQDTGSGPLPFPLLAPRPTWRWACLWQANERGWELTAHEGDEVVPDAGRLLRHFDRQPRVYDSRLAEDRLIMPEGTVLVSPVRLGLDAPSTLIMVGGAPLDEAARLEDLLDGVLRLADALVAKAERAGR